MPLELKLISFNIKMLPRIARLCNLGSDYERAKKIGEYLTKIDADIICMQEVFNPEAEKILDSILLNTYPFKAEMAGADSCWRVSSGLYLVSKIPLQRSTFEVYESRSRRTLDWFSNKGFQTVQLDLAEYPVHIINTHLQAWDEADIRESQLNQLSAHLTKSVEVDKKAGYLLAGDFNIDEADPEYPLMLETLLNPVDTYRSYRPRQEGYTMDPNDNQMAADSKPQRLDYIFMHGVRTLGVESALKLTTVRSDVLKTGDSPQSRLSDHFAVKIEVIVDA
jgi:endonuclease/exonuclease/phosphatase family metal-dependent hydrolase